MGSPEDRAEDVGGIIHFEHVQLFVSTLCSSLSTLSRTCLTHVGFSSNRILRMFHVP